MNYYRVNYNRLARMKQIRFHLLIVIFLLIILALLIVSIFVKASKTESFYGIYNKGILEIKINIKLSDVLKNNEYILFKDKKIKYKIISFDEVEVIGSEVYQMVRLSIDEKLYDNEFGLFKIRYNEKRIIKHILDLFK